MYSIGEVSKMMDLNISTLRYYDKMGILPKIQRKSGIRKFDEKNIEALKVIECLKTSGMGLKDIKVFMQWCSKGDATIEKRLNMFNKQEQEVQKQMNKLNDALNMIKFKKWYYQTALNDKTEKNVKLMNINEMPEWVRELYKKTHIQ